MQPQTVREFEARACLVGERLELRGANVGDRLAADPLAVRVAAGRAVLFRHGVVVFFDVSHEATAPFFERLQPYVFRPLAHPEVETINVRIDPAAPETVQDDVIILQAATIDRLQVIADVLGKSTVLALHESRVAESFRRVEPVAANLEHRGASGDPAKKLLRHIGGVLRSELEIVGRVEVADKPDMTWDDPALERLYVRLADVFEIRERHQALNHKLELVSRTAQTVLEVLQHRHSLRVEWYIVILIVAEILLTLYEMFVRGT